MNTAMLMTGANNSKSAEYVAFVYQTAPYLRVLRIEDWSVVSIPALPGIGYSCDFSGDGSMLAVAHAGGRGLTVFDTSSWSTLPGTPLVSNPRKCRFNKNSSLLAIGGLNSLAVVYKTSTWSLILSSSALSTTLGCSISPDEKYVAFSGSGTVVIKIDSQEVVTSNDSIVTDVTFSPDSSSMAVSSNGSGGLSLYDTLSWERTRISSGLLSAFLRGFAVAYTADSSFVVVPSNTTPNALQLVEVSSLQEFYGGSVLPGVGRSIRFSEDGMYGAYGFEGGMYVVENREGLIDPSVYSNQVDQVNDISFG